MKKLFILSEKELSDIVKARVQGMVDSLTDSIVREVARKNNLNEMQYLWQESNLGYYSCGSSSDGGCGSSSSYSYNNRYGGGVGSCGSSSGRYRGEC